MRMLKAAPIDGRSHAADALLFMCQRIQPHLVAVAQTGYERLMRFGNVEIRPLGGSPGCVLMVALSVLASIILTVLVNLFR